MFLLDAPYVSEFLKQTIRDLGQSVLDTPSARSLTAGVELDFIDESDFAARLGAGEKVLANSENALAHVFKCGCRPELARQIDICKDKALFRETVAELHPDYRFMRASFDALADLDISAMPCPFVVKPTRGFFSLGVHLVDSVDQWPEVVRAIGAERAALNAEYPEEVVNAGEFIVEQGIEGEEYAIDVYYDADGDPVITNILHHHFMSEDDISDRLYYTSTGILQTWLLPFTEYVRDVGRECGFRDFATHIEVRVTGAGDILPIEANPLRFAGWCVADMTHFAWGFNPYECYFSNLRPDWDAILEEREGTATVMVIGDLPPGTKRESIESIDYDGFKSIFSNLLELRKIDYSAYPVFAFAFARMSEAELVDLKEFLVEDFSRFISLK
ncbi:MULTISPECIES: ATP-grasp domain-containing protein [unclassified Pseudodesulfovibrio]|uniref:ATP-grasp domain-containing protein n=1 Tax=unclassified Pseudodesulfovibrio TaxID=2661612 RepID=UPI000FEBC0AC|nr:MULTISPECIES: ATP-grasp domain-containing protein [unclassified Pseudodesulfovibrio]MCJ2165722.1 ATP-grasp domain-containing protein [Pseudodesulfovibrio sp. S3-i]RWU02906.1 ATP-grasp domain-containing protein [Pseudodesulfovibrio sp. S3]